MKCNAKIEKSQLLGVPALEGSSAIDQAEGVYAMLEQLDICNHCKALCYDTTAVNTGRLGGVVILLQHLLGRALICLACRRHISELLGKFAIIGATGRRSTGPGDTLLIRFREAWPNISDSINYRDLNNIVTRFDWNEVAGTSLELSARLAKTKVLLALRRGAFQRGDYHHAANFIVLFLGSQLEDGVVYRLPDLAKISNARFLQRFLISFALLQTKYFHMSIVRMMYFVLMQLLINVRQVADLFTAEEKLVIKRMSVVCSVFYGPHFLTSTLASR